MVITKATANSKIANKEMDSILLNSVHFEIFQQYSTYNKYISVSVSISCQILFHHLRQHVQLHQ